MTAEDLEKFRAVVAEVIKSEDPSELGLYIIVGLIVLVIGSISSFIGSYAQTKGQNLATKEDLQNLLTQTKATEGVKADVAAQRVLDSEIRQGQYQIAVSLFRKMGEIQTNWNRVRYGYTVPPEFLDKNDIVPLTEVYNDLEATHFLLGDALHESLKFQADKILECANVPTDDDEAYNKMTEQLNQLRQNFSDLMKENFEIEEIVNLNRQGPNHA